MKRRDLLFSGAAIGGAITLAQTRSNANTANGLTPPESGRIPVAFLISNGATMIDFTGPWEVFQDVQLPMRGPAFQLYTVSASDQPIRATGGMKIIPDYTLANAPAPKVIVIPAQGDHSEPVLAWLRQSAETADVVMSVCTGAFLLAKTGLLDGKSSTTHHDFFTAFERQHKKVTLKKGARFVEGPKMSSAGGLTSGIDLALRVVERYFGRPMAERTAFYMEYQSKGWQDASGTGNNEFVTAAAPLPAGQVEDPVCGMAIDKGELKADHSGKSYYFCSGRRRDLFLKTPGDFA